MLDCQSSFFEVRASRAVAEMVFEKVSSAGSSDGRVPNCEHRHQMRREKRFARELVKAVNDLAAFTEAYLALKNSIGNRQFEAAAHEKRRSYRHKSVADIHFNRVCEDFA